MPKQALSVTEAASVLKDRYFWYHCLTFPSSYHQTEMEKSYISSTLFYLPSQCGAAVPSPRVPARGVSRTAAPLLGHQPCRGFPPCSAYFIPCHLCITRKEERKMKKKKESAHRKLFSPQAARWFDRAHPHTPPSSAAPPEGNAAPRASQVLRSSVGGDRSPRGQRPSRPGRFIG